MEVAMIDFTAKFKTYTLGMLDYALQDCHATLAAGQYGTDHPYGAKLWAEIDAIRDRAAALSKARKQSTEAKILADYYASIL